MNILFHLGAHCTDDGLLIRSILRNRAVLAKEGIIVPGPGRYRELLGDVSTSLRGAPASEDTEAMLVEAICDDASADRIVLSNENFLCRDSKVLGSKCLYPKAMKAAWLANCFPSHRAEFAIALRNPATFIPDIISRIETSETPREALLEDFALHRMSWFNMVERLHEAVPDARILVWCHEDTPFLWSEIVREVTQHDPFTRLDGALDMAERIITAEGMRRLTEFLENRQDLTEVRRRAAIGTFLEAHAVDEKIETEIDLPGWTEDTIAGLTEAYEEDLAFIARVPGVVLLTP